MHFDRLLRMRSSTSKITTHNSVEEEEFRGTTNNFISETMASSTSIDVLEALLQFKEGGKRTIHRPSHHEVPVPNPLDPTQPHLIEGMPCLQVQRCNPTLLLEVA